MKLDDFIFALIQTDSEVVLTVPESQVFEWIKTGHLTKRHFALWCSIVTLRKAGAETPMLPPPMVSNHDDRPYRNVHDND